MRLRLNRCCCFLQNSSNSAFLWVLTLCFALLGPFASTLGSRNVHLTKVLIPLIALVIDHQNHSKWHKWCHVRYNNFGWVASCTPASRKKIHDALAVTPPRMLTHGDRHHRDIVIPQEFRVVRAGSIVRPCPYTKKTERSSWLGWRENPTESQSSDDVDCHTSAS